jgi:protein-disulfide isomerase
MVFGRCRTSVISLVVVAGALLASGCMWGVVRDAETGDPLAGVTVTYVDANGGTASTATDGNGVYLFDPARGLPAPGSVTFQLDSPGYEPSAETRLVEYNDGLQPTLTNLSSFWEVQSFGLTARAAWSYAGQPTRGPTNARVRIVEFADFQCPYCARFARDTLPQILANYGDRVLFVFRNLPLTTIHSNAYKAAESGECAYQQGAFWQYHDMLLDNQQALDESSLKAYAASLGLDTAAFDQCLDSGSTAPAVEADIAAAQKAASEAGIPDYGTPTFFINGHYIGGAYPYDTFRQAIDAALAEATP